MVSVCLPSDALLQHLPSYLGFSYLGRGVSLHGCSSKVQPLLLTLDEGYLLTAVLPDLQCGIAPLGPPAPAQPRLLGRGVGPPGQEIIGPLNYSELPALGYFVSNGFCHWWTSREALDLFQLNSPLLHPLLDTVYHCSPAGSGVLLVPVLAVLAY